MAAAADPVRGALHDVAEARDEAQIASDRLALVIADYLATSGVSVRKLAHEYDVAPSSVQAWRNRGRELQEAGVVIRHVEREIRRVDRRGLPNPTDVLPIWVLWLLTGVILLNVVLNALVLLDHLHDDGFFGLF